MANWPDSVEKWSLREIARQDLQLGRRRIEEVSRRLISNRARRERTRKSILERNHLETRRI